MQAIRYRHATERQYDAAGNTIWIGPRSIEFVPPPNEDPPPGDPLESAAYEGTEQTAIGLDDGNPPPGISTKTFAYNAANRMASVSENGELLMSYRYNGQGERVYRSGSGQTAHTVFDPSGQWLGDYDEYGQVIQQAIWLNDLPVGLLARLDGGERRVFYIQPDALGTPRVVIDPSRGTQGTAVWRWDLEDEAFGETEPNQDPDGDNTWFVLDMRYPGQQHDSATGFNYNYFRDYDPSAGRYTQSDPIGLSGGLSTYGYVGGNPLSSIDPMGLAEGYSDWNIVAIADRIGVDPSLPPGFVDFVAGFGDEISTIPFTDISISRAARNALGGDSVNRCSDAYRYGGYGGTAFMLLGGGALAGKSLLKRAGTEWSHAVPGRFVRRFTPKGRINPDYKPWMDNPVGRWFVDSRLNGNFASRLEHRMSDLYRQMPGMSALTHPRWNRFRQQLNRFPQWIPGSAMIGSGLSGEPSDSCGC